MATDCLIAQEDTIGPWSEHVKLDVNRRYLPADTTVMARQRDWCTGGFHYIDGFAGTGQPRARGEDRRVEGSPRIALDLARPFDSYTFIEREPWRVARLRKLCAEYPHLKTQVIEADCNEAIPRIVTPEIRWEHRARGFAFLDPFGMQLRYATVKALADTKAIEIVLNLATMAINRNGLPNDPSLLTPLHFERMDSAWGDRGWFDLFYEERPGLWGPQVVKAGTTGAERLGRLFKRHRLEPIFEFVGDPLVVRNSHRQPIYCLLFAGPNATGAKIAADVFGAPRPLPSLPAVTLPLGF